ncbi:uncharacterized protein DNG_03654 [Cephalotrichum gorgonifer]|uniref:DUF7707 domain-containing protein n=1 Tax=Cephalotrichum gorgonifer TaxID=2041049 RepID=A0AAE8MX06_9PEZI|nr:uncharacterized protein DNG_03654 [Cephalotrichum gorgonifer]
MRVAIAYLALAAGLASAADKTPIEEFNIIPGNVPLVERGSWCMGERNTCDELCPGTPKENRCDINTLDYVCTCNNGTEPGLKYYQSSLYYFVCQEAFKQCTETNAGNPVELPKCKDDIQSKCGTLDTADLPDETDDSGSDSSSDETPKSTETTTADAGNDNSEDKGDDGNAASRAAWGTAAIGAAIGAFAFAL